MLFSRKHVLKGLVDTKVSERIVKKKSGSIRHAERYLNPEILCGIKKEEL